MAFTVKRLNFEEYKYDRLHEKHAIATWEPSQHLLGETEENQETL
jgi:hypothetical protein